MCVCFTFIVVDELSRLKKESEQLKSENMRFRSIIDNAGLCALIQLYLFCLKITVFYSKESGYFKNENLVIVYC